MLRRSFFQSEKFTGSSFGANLNFRKVKVALKKLPDLFLISVQKKLCLKLVIVGICLIIFLSSNLLTHKRWEVLQTVGSLLKYLSIVCFRMVYENHSLMF